MVQAELVHVAPGLGQHLRCHVDADHLAVRADLVGGEDGVEPGAAADVDHPLARLQVAQREGAADAREGLDSRVGQTVDDGGGVAEPGRQCTPGVEVERRPWLQGDFAVLLLDLCA